MMTARRIAALATITGFALAGCGGGGSPAAPPANGGSTNTSKTVTVQLSVPGPNAASAHHARKPFYVSRSTAGIGIDYGPSPQNYDPQPDITPKYVAAIAAGSQFCTAAAADGSFKCTFNLQGVPEGYVDFRVTLWSMAPQGSGFYSGVPLSLNVIPNQAVLAGQNNVFSFSLLPVVDSAVLSVSPSSLVSGTASTAKLYLVAKDPAGNIILGNDQFVSYSGDTVTFSVTSSDPTHANVAPASFNTAASAVGTITYDGSPETVPVTYEGDTNTGSVLFINSPIPLAFTTSGGGVSVGGVPQITQSLALPNPPSYAAAGSDGNLWVTTYAPGQFMRVAPGSMPSAVSFGGSIAGCADFTTSGPDNDIWYGDTCNNTVGRFAPGDTISSQEAPSNSILNPLGIITGPDNKIWVAGYNDNMLDSVDPVTMAITQHPIPIANAGIYQLVTGPPIGASGDPSVCYVAISIAAVGCYDITTAATIWYNNSAGYPGTLLTGPDGLLYVGLQTTRKIVALSAASGSLHLAFTYPSTGSLTTYPQWLTIGPDRNVWFVGDAVSSTGSSFGRISIEAAGKRGVLREYATNTGLPGSATLSQILLGPDRNLYVTDFNTQTLDRINL